VTGPVSVIASVLVPPPDLVAYDQRVGLSMRQVNTGTPTVSCTMHVDVSDWVQVGASTPTPIEPGRIVFVLVLEPSPTPGYLAPVCAVTGSTIRPNNLYDATELVTPSLVANVSAEFEWIEVLQ
jgi:hypothetical protein